MTLDELNPNTEAASYIEDDPEAWAHWIDALERYVPELPKLAEHLSDETGALQIIGGSILAYLADRRHLYLTRRPAALPSDVERAIAVLMDTPDDVLRDALDLRPDIRNGLAAHFQGASR